MANVGKLSRRAESQVAKKIKGRRQPASGAFWAHKGDVKEDRTAAPVKDLLIEHKMTGKKSMSVTLEWLEKIEDEALLDGRQAVLVMEIQGRRWYATPEEDFLATREEIMTLHGIDRK